MKKSKLQLAVSMVLLVIVCCSVAGCIGSVVPDTYYQSEDAIEDTTPTTTEILNSYPQDRISVHYYEDIPDGLSSWEVIRKNTFDYYGGMNVTDAVLKIPDGMSFHEAIEYCDTIGVSSIPSNWDLGNHTTINYYQDVIAVCYVDSEGYITHTLPQNMTLPEAIQYYSQLDNVMYVDLVPKPVPLANTDSSIGITIHENPVSDKSSTESPLSIFSTLAGLIGVGIILLWGRN